MILLSARTCKHTHTQNTGIQGYCRFLSAQYLLLHSERTMDFSRPWFSHIKTRVMFFFPLQTIALWEIYKSLKDSLVLQPENISAAPANKHFMCKWKMPLKKAGSTDIWLMRLNLFLSSVVLLFWWEFRLIFLLSNYINTHTQITSFHFFIQKLWLYSWLFTGPYFVECWLSEI